MSNEQVYTHALWRVKPGAEEEFIAAWGSLADAFSALPAKPMWGTLIHSRTDPSIFYSFGPWQSEIDVQAMRSDPAALEALEKVKSCCLDATPEVCDLVRHVQP